MLEEYMKETGLNSREIAHLLNVSPAYVSSVLSGNKPLSKRCEKILKEKMCIKCMSYYTIIKDSVLDKIFTLIVNSEKDFEGLYKVLCEEYEINQKN